MSMWRVGLNLETRTVTRGLVYGKVSFSNWGTVEGKKL